ncbi:hypothetical protein K0M31_001134 [Melipona bicolor]|uniref:Uncharacterized protein n=1 Tax=Melipona bicolor TaxID=60889 RepID=A0AA40GEY3_9HYME|nr:hypothetical protein K0M31_001134 [Melipona bicolor]
MQNVSHCSRFARGGARSRSPDKGGYYLRSCYRPHHPVEKRTNLAPGSRTDLLYPTGYYLRDFVFLHSSPWPKEDDSFSGSKTTSQVRGP